MQKQPILPLDDFGGDRHGKVDCTLAWEKAVKAAHAQQGIIQLTGQHLFTRPIFLERQVSVRGCGKTWATHMRFTKQGALHIDGDQVEGGWCFRNRLSNFLIDPRGAESPEVIKVNKAYTVSLDDVWVFQFGHKGGEWKGIHIEKSNHIVLDRFDVYGAVNDSTQGISIKDASVRLASVDVEVCRLGVVARGGAQVDIWGPHIERCMTAIRLANQGGTTITGGKMGNPSASASLIHIYPHAANVTIVQPGMTIGEGKGIVCEADPVNNNINFIGVPPV